MGLNVEELVSATRQCYKWRSRASFYCALGSKVGGSQRITSVDADHFLFGISLAHGVLRSCPRD
jgi:hypothetical protein